MINRIVLEPPFTPNYFEFECECDSGCGVCFTYKEVFKSALEWLNKYDPDNSLSYSIIHPNCPNNRMGACIAYLEYSGVILATIYKDES
jgi:hypothetical protein